MTDQSTKRFVIKLVGGSYFREAGSTKPSHWLNEDDAKVVVHGKEAGTNKDGSIKYDPKGFDQRAYHNTWQENDKATGKLVKRESNSFMICGQNCMGAQVVEAPDDLETVPNWTIVLTTPKPTINPGIAVREALGLSKEDAQEILGDEVNVNNVDEGFFSDLAAMATLAETANAELLFDIKNPDGSLFKRWRVTADGMFVESR